MLAMHSVSFRSLLISLFVFHSFTLSTPILAASFSWQSPYVGVYLSSADGHLRVASNTGNVTPTSYFQSGFDISAVNSVGSFTNSQHRNSFGIEAGHDWVWKQLLFGVAGDYSQVSFNSHQLITTAYPTNENQYTIFTSMRTNSLFSLRGRLGIVLPINWPSMIYVTSGRALTKLKVVDQFSDNSALAGIGTGHISKHQVGGISGIGAEVGLYSYVTMNIEYSRMHVPSLHTTDFITNTQGGFGIPVQSFNSPFSSTGHFHVNVFKLALNFRFIV